MSTKQNQNQIMTGLLGNEERYKVRLAWRRHWCMDNDIFSSELFLECIHFVTAEPDTDICTDTEIYLYYTLKLSF